MPYRDSKLTQILQPSLSGDARVSVIATVNPSMDAIEETKSTLKFAARVKKVTLHAAVHEYVDDERALLSRYKDEVRVLQEQLEHFKANDKARRREYEDKINGLEELFLTAQNVASRRQSVSWAAARVRGAIC